MQQTPASEFVAASRGRDEVAGKDNPDDGRAVPQSLDALVDKANQDINHGSNRIEVQKDVGSGRFVMRIVDKASGDVIRQYPPETVVRLSERLNELSGMLFATDA